MPNWKYAFIEEKYDTERLAKASGRDLRIKPKHAREICATIKGMKLEQAKRFLEDVIKIKRSVPFRRHKKKQGHRKDLKQFKWYAGKYPIKAAARIYDILTAIESNAEYKGMDLDRLKIINANVHKGVLIKRFIPRAMGRATPKNNVLTHVELVAQEV